MQIKIQIKQRGKCKLWYDKYFSCKDCILGFKRPLRQCNDIRALELVDRYDFAGQSVLWALSFRLHLEHLRGKSVVIHRCLHAKALSLRHRIHLHHVWHSLLLHLHWHLHLLLHLHLRGISSLWFFHHISLWLRRCLLWRFFHRRLHIHGRVGFWCLSLEVSTIHCPVLTLKTLRLSLKGLHDSLGFASVAGSRLLGALHQTVLLNKVSVCLLSELLTLRWNFKLLCDYSQALVAI